MSFIYALRCPISGEIRYIGKANDAHARLATHLRHAKNGRNRYYVANWIRKLARDGLEPRLQILRVVASNEDWRSIEREEIARARANGCRLTNIMAGGQGAVYLDPDGPDYAKRCAALKAAWKKPENKARLAKAMALVFARPETKVKMSDKAKANWKLGCYRNKINNIEAHCKTAEGMRSYWQNNRELMLARMNDPARTAKISRAMKRRNADPAFRAIAHSPEAHAKQAATLKATWARRKAAQS